MSRSDAHLEQSLAEYNDLVASLESGGDSIELVDALLHRSMVLMLLDSYVSSISDLEDALEICENLENNGARISPGVYIRIYENRGQMLFDSNDEQMFDDYHKIVVLMDEFDKETKYYSQKEIITMCLDCAEDLVDKLNFDLAKPFMEKAIYVVGDASDSWSKNRLVEINNILGQIEKEKGNDLAALDYFSKTAILCKSLGEILDDKMELVFALVYSGDIYDAKDDLPNMEKFHGEAIAILEKMNSEGSLDDEELLVNLHQGLATKLMEAGKIKEAEQHLLTVMKLGYPIVKEAMDELGLNKKKS